MPHDLLGLLLKSCWETMYMVALSAALAALAGIPLGIILFTTARNNILENLPLHRILSYLVNALRSTPFIILLVALIPLTRLLVGTSIGTIAAIVPLSIAAIPFLARIVETALGEVDFGIVEAAQAMGASPQQIITKVYLAEAAPAIVLGITLMIINLIGYSAMAGTIGGGGLGDLAIRYGYQRFRSDIMLITVIILIAQVQLVQVSGDFLAGRLNKK